MRCCISMILVLCVFVVCLYVVLLLNWLMCWLLCLSLFLWKFNMFECNLIVGLLVGCKVFVMGVVCGLGLVFVKVIVEVGGVVVLVDVFGECVQEEVVVLCVVGFEVYGFMFDLVDLVLIQVCVVVVV